MEAISLITDAGRLQVALVTSHHKVRVMMGADHRRHLWTAMVGRYLRQTDAAHRHRPKTRQGNLTDRASIRIEGH